MENQLKQDIGNLERSILEIQGQIAQLGERRQAQVPRLVLAGVAGDPIKEAAQAIAAEKLANELATEQTAMYAVLARYEEALTAARADLAQVQKEGALLSSRLVLDAANNELIAIASQIQQLRDRQKELLIQAVKVSKKPELQAALKILGIGGSYVDLWMLSSESSGFDSPNLGKLISLNFASGDGLKELPSTQKWTVVSQSLIKAQDFKKNG
jgi:hypothetical protein